MSTSPPEPNSAIPHTQPQSDAIESQPGDWSDEDIDTSSEAAPEDLESAFHRIKTLEANLEKTKQDLTDYREFVTKSLDVEKLAEVVASTSTADFIVPKRDDDSHYFTSYGSNGTCDLPACCLR